MEGEDTANTKMRKSVLAEVLQTPKWGKASLQKSCKRQNGEKRFCRNAAKPRNFFEVFAGAPQVSRETFWCLRESRKSHGKLFGVCGSPASASGNALAFAGVPQVPRKTFWPLRESRKSLGKLFGVCGIPASIYKVGGLQDGERKCALEPSIQKLNVCIFAGALEQQATRVEISNPYTLYY